MSYHTSKPENALRRAQELQSISQSESALTILHETLSSRRHRTWSPTYEKIMITYIDLCLSLNRARDAKDGLHQYRNLSQSQAPGSLEIVIKYLIDQSEEKCREAKEKSASTDAVVAIPDPDAEEEKGGEPEEKPEGEIVAVQEGDATSMLLLATMAADPAQNQRDSAVLLPRVKFLWEAYRAVLDILKSNSKLERLYHLTAIRALKFCAAYKRRTEFKRLCDLLKQHLDNLKKFGGAAAMARVEEGAAKQNNKIRGWEGWSTDAIELHLETRFTQLEIASTLHQYNEGFKVVEEIYNILQISHSRRKATSGGQSTASPPPKAKLMAKYYEKLTTLFWVSENYLFHAFAWYKYYTLCREFNRGMTTDEKTFQASAVLLSALCIPNLPDSSLSPGANGARKNGSENKIAATQKDEYARKNSARMATLLGFHTRNPTREALLSEIRAKNVMADVPPHLRDFYKLLEETSNPLVLVERAKPLLDKLRAEVSANEEEKATDDAIPETEDAKLSNYVQPLISVLLLKLLHALSASYHTISLDHLQSLTSGLGVTFTQVEKAIVSAATSKQTAPLRVRIDHRARCLRFGDSAVRAQRGGGGGNGYPLESGTMRSHLTVLSRRLYSVCKVINPPNVEGKSVEREKLYRTVRAAVDGEHVAMLARKDLIEKRKEEAERLTQEKLKAEELKRREVLRNAQEEEERRLDREKHLREREKMDRIKKEVEMTEKKALLKALGHNVEVMSDKELITIDVQKLAREHAERKAKAKDDAERKVKEMEKKLDYIVRATRIEEVPLVKKRYEEKVRLQKERYEADVVEKARNAKIHWEKDCEEKVLLNAHSIFDFMKDFEGMVMTGRVAVHEAKIVEEDKRAEDVAEKGKLQRARKRKEDEQRRIKEEEERIIREEEERKAEVEKQAREKERRKLDEEKRLAEEERRKKEDERLALERARQRERDSAAPAPMSKDLENASGKKYVPPSSRGKDQGSRLGGASSSRTWGDSRGGSYGGGRYEGNREERFGGGGGRDGGGGDRYGARGDRYGGGGDRGSERYGGGDRGGDRYGGGGDRFGGRGDRSSGGGDRGGDRYGGGGDRGGDRYGGGGDRGSDRYGGGGDRGSDRYGGGGDRGSDRYGGGGDRSDAGADKAGARGGGRWGNLS